MAMAIVNVGMWRARVSSPFPSKLGSRCDIERSSFVGAAPSCSLSSTRALSGGWSVGLFGNTALGLPVRKGVERLVVKAGKASMACTKRSRSRKSRARAQGFRVRMSTPGGRNVLRRRRRKGRKVLVPQSNPNSGKRA